MCKMINGFKNLKILRQNAGYQTAKEAADALNISLSMLQKIEIGERCPSTRLVQQMSITYKCQIEEIFFALRCTESA